LVADEVRFAADLYRGAAEAFDRYRLPYPAAMPAEQARNLQPVLSVALCWSPQPWAGEQSWQRALALT
jgi:hypothetical protein